MNDFFNDLKTYMDDVETTSLDIIKDDTFKIESKEQAGYFLRKILDLKAQKEEIILTAKSETERLLSIINSWQEKETTNLDNTIDYFSCLLKEFTEKELENSEKRSIKLPFGTLGFKKQPPHYDYDDSLVKEWLKKENSELLEKVVDFKYNKTDLKKIAVIKDNQLFLNGKAIDGITVTNQEDLFIIK